MTQFMSNEDLDAVAKELGDDLEAQIDEFGKRYGTFTLNHYNPAETDDPYYARFDIVLRGEAWSGYTVSGALASAHLELRSTK